MGRISDDLPSAGDAGAHLRWRRGLLLLIALAAAVHTLLPQLATIEAAADVLRALQWWAVALAVAAQALSYCGNAYTLRSCARIAGDELPIGASVTITLAAGAVGPVTAGPIGTAAATHHWSRRRGVSRDGALLCGWLPGMLNLMVLVALALVGIGDLLLRHLLPHSLLLALAVLAIPAALAVAAGAYVLARESKLMTVTIRGMRLWRRIRRREPGTGGVAPEALDRQRAEHIVAARRMLTHGGWHRPLAGALLNAGFDILTLGLLFVAARHSLSPGALLAGYGLPQLLGRVTFLPGGVGIIEGGMVGMYALLGVPPATGVLVVLAYRGLSFWLPTITGLPFVLGLQRGSGRRERRG